MSAKDIVLRPISSKEAGDLVKRIHYSGKVVNNSQLHIGVFYGGRLEGAMQFGPSIDKRKTSALVRGSGWHEFTELNRMAFSEALPRNSESRALGVAFRLLVKYAPQVKWIISFADAAQCGDGTIYRASGFLLTGIKKNEQLLLMPNGKVIARKSLDNPNHTAPDGRFGSIVAKETGATSLPGYQFRYVRFLDPSWVDRLTVPIIPFDKIPDQCKMYRGKRGGSKETPGVQPGAGGASPTPPLHIGVNDDP